MPCDQLFGILQAYETAMCANCFTIPPVGVKQIRGPAV